MDARRPTFTRYGGPYEPTVDNIPEDLELREQALPDPTHWQLALQRASSLFGLTLGQTLNAANVGKLVDDVKQKTAENRELVTRLVVDVRDRIGRYAAGTTSARQQTAESTQALLAALAQAAEADVVATLALAELQTTEAAVGRTLGQAKTCVEALAAGGWEIFDAVRKLSDHRAAAAQNIVQRLVEVLTSDEHVVPLRSRLDELRRDALALLAAPAPTPAPTPEPSPEPTPVPGTVTIPPVPGNLRSEVVAEQQNMQFKGADAIAALEALKARVASEQDLELTLSWRLQRKGTQP